MDDASLVMVAPIDVATRDGVTTKAVTKLVRQMVERNALPVERDTRGRIVRFSLAHYDHIRGRFSSSARTSAARRDPEKSGSPSAPRGDSRDEALRQEAWLKVGREKIRRQEEIGQLVRADRLRDGLTVSGREIQNLVARLQNRADDLAMAVTREGVHGLRQALRKIAFEINREIADRLADIAEHAAETDPLVGEESEVE